MPDARFRERPTCEHCGSTLPYPPDPPLQMPEGYSMMAMLEQEGAGTHPMVQPKPAVQSTNVATLPKKKHKKKKG